METTTLLKLNLAVFGNLFRRDPEDLTDQELLALDFNLHRAWVFKREGHRIFFGEKNWSFKDMLDLHVTVQIEMSNRSFKHTLQDELTDQSAPLIQQEGAVEEDVEKGVRQAFGSYGGKRALASKIASYIPLHKTYVEPFAGGAAVLYAKSPSPEEVLNDRDSEIAFMHKFIRDLTAEDIKVLSKRDWVLRKETHERLKKLKPTSKKERFYKNYYLQRSSYGKQRGESFNPANAGVKIDFEKTIEGANRRLQNVDVFNKDYQAILKKFDGKDTFFYLDPPYPDTYNQFDFGFDEEEFIKALRGLEANWIASYSKERSGAFKGFKVMRVKRRNQMKGPGGNKEWITEILASNFDLKPLHLFIEKSTRVDEEIIIEECEDNEI